MKHKVAATRAEIDALRHTVPPGPIVMINLFKFKAGTGKQDFIAYLRAAELSVPRDSELIYTGACGVDLGDGEAWDFVGIARYSSFNSFADFINGEAYQRDALPFREKALERTIFLITQPAPFNDYFGAFIRN